MWWRLQPPISSPIGALQPPPRPPLGLLHDHARRAKVARVSSAHHEEVGGLPVASIDIASSSNSRYRAATGERLASEKRGKSRSGSGVQSPGTNEGTLAATLVANTLAITPY